MTARRIVSWMSVLGILAAAGAAAWWFFFSPAAEFRLEYVQLVRWQEEYRPMVLPPFPGMAPAAAPEVYDARVKGATERLGRDLRSFDGTSGLELLRTCFQSNAEKPGSNSKRDQANRLVAQRIGVQYCLELPADRLRQTLEYVNQSEWSDAILPYLLKIFVERFGRVVFSISVTPLNGGHDSASSRARRERASLPS